jgi:hypothetical protein
VGEQSDVLGVVLSTGFSITISQALNPNT